MSAMETEVAAHAGFCFGVQRAVEICEREAKKGGKVYTYGPIIHNEAVVSELREKGVEVLWEDANLEQTQKGTVIIRSHGVAPMVYQKLEDAGFTVVDATCPFVKKIHNAVAEYARLGYHILVTGDPAHPEVQGICGYALAQPIDVVESAEDARKLQFTGDEKILVVSQTTFHQNKLKDIVEIFSEKSYDNRVCILNTICSATAERQSEADELSRRVEAMIVIGSRSSSNTRKLYEICSANCTNTVLVQDAAELDTVSFIGGGRIGITAGASTPKKIIQEVSRYVRDEL